MGTVLAPAKTRPRSRGGRRRRPAVELAAAALLVPATAIALHPGIGLAGVVALLFMAVRLGAWATVRTWRRVRTGSRAGRRRRGRAGPVRRVAAVMTVAAIFTLVLA